MRLNPKRRLAVDCMVDLALRVRRGPVSLAALAHRQKVSLSGLEQLFARLRAAGLVQSTRGPGGGYTLGRDAAAISVAAIVAAVETGVPAGDGDSRFELADELAHRLQAVMQTHMAGIALADLVAGQTLDDEVAVPPLPYRLAIAPRPKPRHITDRVPNSVFELGTVMARSGARSYGR